MQRENRIWKIFFFQPHSSKCWKQSSCARYVNPGGWLRVDCTGTKQFARTKRPALGRRQSRGVSAGGWNMSILHLLDILITQQLHKHHGPARAFIKVTWTRPFNTEVSGWGTTFRKALIPSTVGKDCRAVGLLVLGAFPAPCGTLPHERSHLSAWVPGPQVRSLSPFHLLSQS